MHVAIQFAYMRGIHKHTIKHRNASIHTIIYTYLVTYKENITLCTYR